MTKIKPAMTPEEWAQPTALDPLAAEWIVREPMRREALAARALYGRISWEMVDALRSAAEELHWDDEVAAQVESAAALLESLLPPRVPQVWNEDTNQWDRRDAHE